MSQTRKFEMDQVDMKGAYVQAIESQIDQGEPIVMLTADFTYGMGLLEFEKKYPDHFINMGIAEQNMASFAAGLATEGYLPFIHAFAVFCCRRALDQIYISDAYSKLNVKVVGADPGYMTGHNGGTHMAMEDVGIFRMIPGALIVEPTDATMVKKLIPQITAYKGFTYIRLTRKKTVKIYDESAELTLGKAKKLKEGNQLTVITGGQCVADALEAADILETENISIRVLDMFTIKPLDTEAVWRAATETGGILVVENHSRKGGIGTAVLEVLGGKLEIPFQCMGREDIFGEVGTEQELKERYQLTTQDIVEQARIMLSEKHENNFTK